MKRDSNAVKMFTTGGCEVSAPMYAAYDVGIMFDNVSAEAKVNIADGAAGTIFHYGGNNTDSYLAGYILYWAGDQFIWGIQMNANGSDAAIVVDGHPAGDYDIACKYKDGNAQLWLNGEMVAEQAGNWVQAEGGIVSLLTGSHLSEGDGGENKDEASGITIKHLEIWTGNGWGAYGIEGDYSKIFDDDGYGDAKLDSPQYHCYDVGVMFDKVIVSIDVEISEAGSIFMYGGNNTDSYLAGYILYWGGDQFIWGIQMNANGSAPAIVCDGYPAGKYRLACIYKDGNAQLWINGKLACEQAGDWVMAEGGIVSLLTGSHLSGDEGGENKDESPAGSNWIKDLQIWTQGGRWDHMGIEKASLSY
jgi:hypothetical protein